MNQPIGYRMILELARRIAMAIQEDDPERAKALSVLLRQVEAEYPEAKQRIDEDYPGVGNGGRK